MLNKNTILLKFLFLLIIGGSALFFLLSWSQNKAVKVPVNSQAKIEIPVVRADLGQMKVQEEKYAEFKIKNIGSSPLKIYRVFTSCMCTFAKIFLKNPNSYSEFSGFNWVWSPAFSMQMHNSAEALRWQGEIQSQETAIVRVIYKPALMPVYGPVERSVVFSTNDPKNQQVELIVKAFVQQ